MVPDRLKALTFTNDGSTGDAGSTLTEKDASDEKHAPKSPLEAMKVFVAATPRPKPDQILAELQRIQASDREFDSKAVMQVIFDVLLPDLVEQLIVG